MTLEELIKKSKFNPTVEQYDLTKKVLSKTPRIEHMCTRTLLGSSSCTTNLLKEHSEAVVSVLCYDSD